MTIKQDKASAKAFYPELLHYLSERVAEFEAIPATEKQILQRSLNTFEIAYQSRLPLNLPSSAHTIRDEVISRRSGHKSPPTTTV